ncbi:iron uptake transporter deferrochelatase/peroxidase subunit [Nocardioides sp. MH1]|uniref:iron uptake transporter deferrochelatase/peroxidase subunit n=1 Tax=Nocardioides sp. MH1 TaxID=3242490 RepID=UPI0035201C07
MTRVSRRNLFAGAGGGLALGAAAGFGAAHAVGDDTTAARDAVDLTRSYDFYTGDHQAGIATPPQRHCIFMTFDMVDGVSAADLQVLLARWSAAIAQLMAGEPVGQVEPVRSGAVGTDTGEALDLAPASLTVTLGLGPGLFDDRFGLASKRPKLLEDLPALPSDQLRPGTTGGDLALQACADDPQVAYHAIRDLARMGKGVVDTGWTVMGFGRASAGAGQSTPRNLMGFKDGTRNIEETADLDEHVWIDDDPAWAGGTYWVVRKIQMNIETWDADDVADQQQVFGRTKVEGAPLSGRVEHDEPDFSATKDGAPVIPPTSHVALAAPENNGGTRILRRGYNYTDGINELAQLDAGLLFVGFCNDPASFIKLQTRLGTSDRLNEYISHIGSALFVAPPAPRRGHYLGEALFG